MTIKFNETEKGKIAQIAKEFKISPIDLQAWYLDMMEANFYQDIYDMAKEVEEEF